MSTSGNLPSSTKVLETQLIVAQAKAAEENANKRAKAKKESSKPIIELPGDGSDKENEGKSGQDTEKKDVVQYVTNYGTLNTNNSFPHRFMRWADAANFHLTDKLITSIEGSIRY
jgi:hypothetical protein